MRRTLGGSEVAVTALGFGAASIGNLYREVSDEQAASAIDAAATATDLNLRFPRTRWAGRPSACA
jgi:aryl-alcohol dehydrogenase-like predicted oxidoreductase